MEATERLRQIAEELNQGHPVPAVSVRELLSWFNAERRGNFIVWLIRETLSEKGLVTEPDFESTYIDSELEFKLAASAVAPTRDVGSGSADGLREATRVVDPTFRLSRLEAANRPPLSVSPTASIAEAVTLMATNDFSQLPVMTGARDVKGMVSWAAIGLRFGLGQTPVEVRDVMEEHHELSAATSLFQAIPLVVQHQCVLVRGLQREIVGIITASDLSLQFQQLSEPFILLGEIENHIRVLIGSVFSKTELASVKNDADSSRVVAGVNDLTFGEYLKLIEEPSRWTRLRLQADRKVICSQLERVRSIRNDVMHFDPDGVAPSDLDHLRKVAQFLRRIAQIGVTDSVVAQPAAPA